MTRNEKLEHDGTRIYNLWYQTSLWAKCTRCKKEANKDQGISRPTFLANSVNCPECAGTRLDAIPWTELFSKPHWEGR